MNTAFRAAIRLGCLLVTLSLTAGPGFAWQPSDQDILGWDEWAKTGQFANEIVINDSKQGYQVVFPGLCDGYNLLPMRLTFTSSPDKSRPLLQIGPNRGALPFESSLFAHDLSDYFVVAQPDSIPVYGHIYHIQDGGRAISMKRVTDRIPQEFRPDKKSRTIAMNAHHATLFWEHDALNKDKPRVDWILYYDRVRISKIDRKTGRAMVELTPMCRAPKPSQLSDRKPLTLEVAKGDRLTARGRSYHVLNVVPQQYVKDAGRLVGWIELSADPVDAAPLRKND